MQLDEFVREVLVQICKGVSEAREPARKLGGEVNPLPMDSVARSQTVDFDVAIVSESVAEGGGKAKLNVLGFGIGGDIGASRQTTDSLTNRIRFTVPLTLPIGDQTKRR